MADSLKKFDLVRTNRVPMELYVILEDQVDQKAILMRPIPSHIQYRPTSQDGRHFVRPGTVMKIGRLDVAWAKSNGYV